MENDPCAPNAAGPWASKRLVRLSFNQLTTSIRTIFGDALADQIAAEFALGDRKDRPLPPLAAPSEGWVVTDAVWSVSDGIGQLTRLFALENFDELTGCGTSPSEECAEDALLELAELADRRPLETADASRLLQVFEEVRDTDASIEESFSYGVYAIVSSPQFLYRTEFGEDPEAAGPLTSYELASTLSYFLTDGPPDEELLEVAATATLSDDSVLLAQASRLLETRDARQNLSDAVYSHFGIGQVKYQVLDPSVAPDWDGALGDSMAREAELFLNTALWEGHVGDLLTSRETRVDDELAALYGVEYPSGQADDDGFAPVTLPGERAGMVTNAAYLTRGSRPDGVSVILRGVQAMKALACAEVPPSPEVFDPNQLDPPDFSDATEREKMEYRLADPVCSACHHVIDPFGLVLYEFDALGRYRTTDPEGRPLDSNVTLVDGTELSSARELAEHLAHSGEFSECLARSMLMLAVQDAPGPSEGCLLDDFDATDRSFEDLVLELAASGALSERSAPETL